MAKRIFSFFDKKSPRRVTLGIAFLKAGKALLGVVSVMVMAHYFGITLARDQWVVAVTIIAALIQFIFGPMNETFRSRLAVVRTSSEDEFRLTLSSVLKWMTLMSVVLALLCLPFLNGLVQVFGYQEGMEGTESLRFLVLISLPTLTLIEVTTVFAGALNLFGVFFIPEIFGLVSVIINTVFVIAFAHRWGIYSLWLGNFVSLGVLLVALTRNLSQLGIQWREVVSARFGPFWDCFKFSSAMFLPLIVAQLSVLTERTIAARIGVGNVSALDYARKFLDVPLGVITAAIATVLGPVLADLFGKKDLESFYGEAARVARMMILGAIPLLLVLFASSEILIRILLRRGAFDAAAVKLTSELLRLFVPGVLGAILYSTIVQSLLASGRMRLLVVVTVLLQAGITLGNVTLSHIWGVYAFPVSWASMHLLVGMILVFGLVKESRRDGLSVLGAVGLALFLGGVFFSLRQWMDPDSWTFLLVVSGGGVLAVFLAIYGLGLREERAILQKFFPAGALKSGSTRK